MASKKILKNLISLFSDKKSGTVNRRNINNLTDVSEVKTMKVKTQDNNEGIVVYDVLKDYVYTDLSASLSYSTVSGQTYHSFASGGFISPIFSASIKEGERGNSNQIYDIVTFEYGQNCHHSTNPSAIVTYTFNYESGITDDDVTINSNTGVISVNNRLLSVDTGSESRALGTVTANLIWADKTLNITSNVIYQQKNKLENIVLTLNPNPVNYNETTDPTVIATYTSGETNNVTSSSSFSIADENYAVLQ